MSESSSRSAGAPVPPVQPSARAAGPAPRRGPMGLPLPTPRQLVALAALVRDRVSGLGDTAIAGLSPLLGRLEDEARRTARPGVARPDRRPAPAAAEAGLAAAREVAVAIVGAAAPFAATSYARARLLRQLHATGLLSADEAARAAVVLDATG